MERRCPARNRNGREGKDLRHQRKEAGLDRVSADNSLLPKRVSRLVEDETATQRFRAAFGSVEKRRLKYHRERYAHPAAERAPAV